MKGRKKELASHHFSQKPAVSYVCSSLKIWCSRWMQYYNSKHLEAGHNSSSLGLFEASKGLKIQNDMK